MIPVLCIQGITALAAFQIAGDASPYMVRIPVIPAANVLTQVAAYSPHSANLRGGNGCGSLGKQFIFSLNRWRLCDVLQPGQGAYPEPVCILADLVQIRDRLDVDDGFRIVGKYFIF